MKIALRMVVTLMLVSLGGGAAFAQVAGIAREVVEAAAETIFRQASKEAAKDLAEIGGRAAVKEAVEKAATEGGEKLVQRTVAYSAEYGPTALRTIARSPRVTITALDAIAPEMRATAIAAITRDPALMEGLMARFGGEALEVAGKHPGVGAMLVEKLGQEGVTAGRQLTTDQAIVVARHADELKALAPAERQSFMDMLGQSPGKVVGFLEAHPKTVLTASAVALIVANKDEIIGTAGTATSEGKVGLIERAASGAGNYFRTPIMIFAGLVLAGVAGKVGINLRAHYRRKLAR